MKTNLFSSLYALRAYDPNFQKYYRILPASKKCIEVSYKNENIATELQGTNSSLPTLHKKFTFAFMIRHMTKAVFINFEIPENVIKLNATLSVKCCN